jgi:cell division protein FtsB
MPDQEVDITSLRFNIKIVVAIIAVVCTILGSGYATYHGISSHIQTLETQLSTQTKQIETLQDSNDMMKQQLLELTVTLRTKEIIK